MESYEVWNTKWWEEQRQVCPKSCLVILFCGWDTRKRDADSKVELQNFCLPLLAARVITQTLCRSKLCFEDFPGEKHYSNQAINAPFITPSFSKNTFNAVSLSPLSPHDKRSSLKAPAGCSVHQEKLMFATTCGVLKIPVSSQRTTVRWEQPDWLLQNFFCNLPT